MLTLQDITYIHPNRELLFSGISLVVNKQDKIALIGNNGVGKSTLLKILAGELSPASGSVRADPAPYYVPQIFGQYNEFTVAQALRIENKLNALEEILEGTVTDENMALLDNDWTIEQRCGEAFTYWKLDGLSLSSKLKDLSGGQKTKVFLAGMHIHESDVILLDEPSNHLDTQSRNILYHYIRSTKKTLLIVSHDRTLLNLLNATCELSPKGITIYGGNYDFYASQKMIENEALNEDLKSKEKALRKAKETERESLERQQKLDARGKKKQEKAGLPTISMKTFKNNAEKSTSRIKGVHTVKVNAIAQELTQLRKELPVADKMKMGFDSTELYKGKLLIDAININFSYNDKLLWKRALSFQIRSGERVVIRGSNGSGKTTLIKMILGEMEPQYGTITMGDIKTVYIDQDYSLIDNNLSVYEQVQRFNSGALQEHEIKIRLNRFLFTREDWDKPCTALSGGERMRLSLCCLTISDLPPDMIILDEPTNNLDVQNIRILTAAINEYNGTLLVVSHDEIFLKEIRTERSVAIE